MKKKVNHRHDVETTSHHAAAPSAMKKKKKNASILRVSTSRHCII